MRSLLDAFSDARQTLSKTSSEESTPEYTGYMMDSVLPIILSVALSTYAFLWSILRMTQSKTEPLAVQNVLPFVSPGIYMWWRGPKYWIGSQQ